MHVWHEIVSLTSQGERRYLKEDEAAEYELPQQSHVDVSPAYYSNSSVPRSEEVRALVRTEWGEAFTVLSLAFTYCAFRQQLSQG